MKFVFIFRPFVMARCDRPWAFSFAKSFDIFRVQGSLADQFCTGGMEL